MCQPAVDGAGPLMQVEGGKLAAVERFQRDEDFPHCVLGMSRDATKGQAPIQAVMKLDPHGLWLVQCVFEGHRGATPGGDQTQAQRQFVGRQRQMVGEFLQENQRFPVVRVPTTSGR